MIKSLYSIFILLAIICIPTQGQLVINEFMASNDTGLEDEFGTHNDWIEIYNTSSSSVNMGGWYITDDLDNLVKWQIPATNSDLTTIPANGYLILWADVEPEQGVLHLNFKLGKDGESIGISKVINDVVTLVDQVTFGAQLTDVSSGRCPNGSGSFVKMYTPTPLSINNCINVGIREEAILKFEVNPNPFDNVVTVNLPYLTDARFELLDISGRLVFSYESNGTNQVTIDLPELRQGVYFARISQNGLSSVKKVVRR